MREEQLKTRVITLQAEPILLEDLIKKFHHIHSQLLHCANLTYSEICVLARDQAIFKVSFFVGDLADLIRLKPVDILRFLDYSSLTIFGLNHYGQAM